MKYPIILSDDDEEDYKYDKIIPETPLSPLSKKPRSGPDPFPTILVLDDPTPLKPYPNPSTTNASTSYSRISNSNDFFLPGRSSSGLICLESDSEDEGGGKERGNLCQTKMNDVRGSHLSHADASQPNNYRNDINNQEKEKDHPDKENFASEETGNLQQQKRKKANAGKKKCTDEDNQKKKLAKDERARLMEEKKLKKEQEKLEKAALKAEAAEFKKTQKEKEKWGKGKFAQESIMAEIDTKVVELRSVGGPLLSRFADKGLTYRITSNPIERSIVWTMKPPEHISEVIEIPYILLVYEADEFCSLVANESLLNQISRVRKHYPSYTICCITNKLMSYIHKREKDQYKNSKGQGGSSDGWKTPPVQELLAKLATHFMGVYSRQCVDEAELADHVVGLTGSLATCQFRPKLTRLSVNANGSFITKDFIDRDLMKKSPWLKALAAIPKVQPRFAMAIWKKYPTMKSLLNIYMDPTKSLHDKEFLLKDLIIEGLLGDNRRLGEVCSKRVYRVLMAQSGSIKTDDIEMGADYFTN
ncbi:hypothetical protein ACFE04_019106 [Oxalis oulophora]